MEPNLTQIFGSYSAWLVEEGTYFINFMNGSQNLYLLEGEEKALLTDTGWGAGNLREFVEKLTDKPILVINTHFHPDHAAGNGEFESVYMSGNYEILEAAPAHCYSSLFLYEIKHKLFFTGASRIIQI